MIEEIKIKIKNLDEAIQNTQKGLKGKEGSRNYCLYSQWPERYARTIEDFYKQFIEERLPDPDVVRRWHEILVKYTEEDNVILPIRDGATSRNLRRGWLVRLIDSNDKTKGFSYMFADNDLAVYIYKMCLDGYCPEYDEFKNYMTEFVDVRDIGYIEDDKKDKVLSLTNNKGERRRFIKMPIHFHQIAGKDYPDKYESEKNVFINTEPAPKCCLGDFGYKHAHIFDARKGYFLNGKKYDWKNFTGDDFGYAQLGNPEDYIWDDTIQNYCWTRECENIDIEKEKKIIRAHSLRFLDPINHFLSPLSGNNKYTKSTGDFSLDIAEYDRLQDYMKYIKSKIFGDMFKEYRTLILADSSDNGENFKEDEINLIYHEKSLSITSKENKKRSQANSQKKETKNSKPNITLNPQNIDEFKRELIITKTANIIWIFSDGHKEIDTWHANNVKESTDIMSNVMSKKIWREKEKNGLKEVKVEIVK